MPRRVSHELASLDEEARRVRQRIPETLRALAFARQPELLSLERTYAQLSLALLAAKIERVQLEAISREPMPERRAALEEIVATEHAQASGDTQSRAGSSIVPSVTSLPNITAGDVGFLFDTPASDPLRRASTAQSFSTPYGAHDTRMERLTFVSTVDALALALRREMALHAWCSASRARVLAMRAELAPLRHRRERGRQLTELLERCRVVFAVCPSSLTLVR